MRLIKTAIKILRRVATKKIRRRTRAKGSLVKSRNRRGANYYTQADQLRDSFYHLPKSPPAKHAGAKRAEKRLALHRKQWAKTPDKSRMTRQRIRAAMRAGVAA